MKTEQERDIKTGVETDGGRSLNRVKTVRVEVRTEQVREEISIIHKQRWRDSQRNI